MANETAPSFAQRSATGTAMSSTAAVLYWSIKCAVAEKLLMPDEIALIAMAGWIHPVALAIRDYIISRFEPKGLSP